jgi:hypothetical protein
MRDKLCLRDGGPLVSAFRSLLVWPCPDASLTGWRLVAWSFFRREVRRPPGPTWALLPQNHREWRQAELGNWARCSSRGPCCEPCSHLFACHFPSALRHHPHSQVTMDNNSPLLTEKTKRATGTAKMGGAELMFMELLRAAGVVTPRQKHPVEEQVKGPCNFRPHTSYPFIVSRPLCLDSPITTSRQRRPGLLVPAADAALD